MSVAESVYPLGEVTECIVRDCFAILTCKEIRAYNLEQFEDMDEATENEFCKTELDMRRVVVIEPVIPVISNLKNVLTDSESDLYRDIIYFLKELLHDFKDSIRDILAVDKLLLNLVELSLKTDTEKERADKKIEKELKDKNKHTNEQQREQSPVTITDSTQTMTKDNSVCAADNRDPKPAKTTKVPSPTTARNLRKLSQSIIPEEDRPSTSARSRSSTPQPASRSRSSTPKPASRSSTPQPLTYNVVTSTPAEASEIQRLATAPRVLLKKFPLSTNILNTDTSRILNEPMVVDELDDD